jgi:HAD superfamily hydrolase (TIGR01484 family)
MPSLSPLTRPLKECPQEDLGRVQTLLFDVDDTVTLHGELPEAGARALYRAAEAGLRLIAVTGRSASWAELLVRLFPLAGAVAETGAMAFLWEGERLTVHHAEPSAAVREDNDRRRRAAEKRVLAEVPVARLALDNIGRVYDSAFDLIEDGPLIEEQDAAQIRGILEEEGLTVAQSSVHINAWFGRFDKATMSDRALQALTGRGLDEDVETRAYAGDSKNDAAMFARVPLSVGVANVAPHLEDLAAAGSAPSWITAGEGGHGFAELVDALIAARA